MYFLILAIIAVIVIIVSVKSSMLRNQIFNLGNFEALAASAGIKNPKAAFSLGRSQMAFWTVIIVSTFVYIYLYSNPFPFLAPNMADVNLTLLGISAGTTAISKAIDNSQKDPQDGTVSQQDYPSQGFLIDIISDENGVSIHRLQNVIWTFVIGAIYIAYVAHSGKIPDDTVITPQLLTLIGISAGAYLGLKTTENKAPATAPNNLPPPPPPAVPNPVMPNNQVPAQPANVPFQAAANPVPVAPPQPLVPAAHIDPAQPVADPQVPPAGDANP